MGSAVGAVYSSYINRQLAHDWQTLMAEHTDMNEEYGRLMLEYSTLAAPSRVEQIARDRLQMAFPKKEDIKVINIQKYNE